MYRMPVVSKASFYGETYLPTQLRAWPFVESFSLWRCVFSTTGSKSPSWQLSCCQLAKEPLRRLIADPASTTERTNREQYLASSRSFGDVSWSGGASLRSRPCLHTLRNPCWFQEQWKRKVELGKNKSWQREYERINGLCHRVFTPEDPDHLSARIAV